MRLPLLEFIENLISISVIAMSSFFNKMFIKYNAKLLKSLYPLSHNTKSQLVYVYNVQILFMLSLHNNNLNSLSMSKLVIIFFNILKKILWNHKLTPVQSD